MYKLRKSEERGKGDFGWLKAKYSFSFSQYVDADHMGFGPLRVINEDRIAPGMGFGEHGHREMEIITFVIDGQLRHRDSLGNEGVINPNRMQRMSAGTGIRHSEFNDSQEDGVHMLQIWLEPGENGNAPSYEEKEMAVEDRLNRLQLLASPEAEEGSMWVGQDARLYAVSLEANQPVEASQQAGRHWWVQVFDGELTVNSDVELSAGDGLAISDEEALVLSSTSGADLILFDLPYGETK